MTIFNIIYNLSYIITQPSDEIYCVLQVKWTTQDTTKLHYFFSWSSIVKSWTPKLLFGKEPQTYFFSNPKPRIEQLDRIWKQQMHMWIRCFEILSNGNNCNSRSARVKFTISGVPNRPNYCVIFTIYNLKMLPMIAYHSLAGSGLDILGLN